MPAIQESFGNYSFRSAAIITEQSFNLSRSHLSLEVRASFPSSNVLHGAILLLSDHPNTPDLGIANVNNTIVSGYFSFPRDNLRTFKREPKHNEFSIFNLDILNGTNFMSAWYLNGSVTSQSLDLVDLTCDYLTCDDSFEFASFKLAIMLIVESGLNEDFQTVLNKSKDWGCSSMIINYIKVFDLEKYANPGEFNRNLNEKQAREICLINRYDMEVERNMKNNLVLFWIFMAFIGFLVCLTIWVGWWKKMSGYNQV